MKTTEKLIENFAEELRSGKISLLSDDSIPWKYYLTMNTMIGNNIVAVDDKVPTWKIVNLENTALNIEKYFDVARDFYKEQQDIYNLYNEEFDKKLLFDLVTNATNFELLNFDGYVELKTKMLETKVDECEFDVGTMRFPFGVAKLSIKIQRNDSKLEGPYKFTPIFQNEDGAFMAPSIAFGVVGKEAFVYTIQAQREKQENVLSKKLDRYFRKFNKDVDLNEIEGMVSPNALASAVIFFTCVQKQGIKNVTAPAFLPGRYHATESSIQHQNLGDDERQEKLEKQDRNQFNMTNRFTYTLIRYATHFDGCEFAYNDDIQTSRLVLSKRHSDEDNEIFKFEKQLDNNLKQNEISK